MPTTAKNMTNLCTNVLKICYGYVISSMGLIAEMSYKEIPEAFQPLSIANNKYTFTDGVYSLETDKLIDAHVLVETIEGFSRTLILVATDDTATGQDPPAYVRGIRRVRNVCVDVDFCITTSVDRSIVVPWIMDVFVLRQGQTQAFPTDVLCTRGGITRTSGDGTLIRLVDEENFSICYPGYVDLNSGDSIVVRFSGRQIANSFRYDLGLSASCCVRFG